MSEEPERLGKVTFFFYKDANGDWRWKRITPSGHIDKVSSQGHPNRGAAEEEAKACGYVEPDKLE